MKKKYKKIINKKKQYKKIINKKKVTNYIYLKILKHKIK